MDDNEERRKALVKVQQSRLRDPMPHMPDRVTEFTAVRSRKGSKLLLPHNHLPPRCIRMWKKGELTPVEAYIAAMYVYGVRTNFVLWDVGTNFPQHERVQTSVKVRLSPGHTVMSMNLESQVKRVLDHCLIEEGAFIDVPGIVSAKRVSRHREGKRLFRQALRKFSETSDLPGIS